MDSLSTVCGIHHVQDDVCAALWRRLGPRSAYSSSSCLSLLSSIGRMQKTMDMFVKDGVQADAFRGLVIPITHSMSSQGKLNTEAEKSLRDCSGPSTTEAQPLSKFGAHWESIAVAVPGHDCTSSCALCSACVDAVCRYREETEVFAKRFEELLIRQEDIWEQAGWSEADICELAFSFQQAYFQNEPFYNTYVAALDDSEILRYLCQQGRFALPKGLSKCVLPGDGEDLGALSAHFRESCRIFYQPLKEFMRNATIRDVSRFVVAPQMSTERGVETLDVVVGFASHTLIGIYLAT
ncbi:hypothetical protein FI667_g11860, partial [Globisporangium splendens]